MTPTNATLLTATAKYVSTSARPSWSTSVPFCYEPRDYERAYYQSLWDYVANHVNNNNNDNNIATLPSKLVAKLFLQSKIPADRLRIIWNMATNHGNNSNNNNNNNSNNNNQSDNNQSNKESANAPQQSSVSTSSSSTSILSSSHDTTLNTHANGTTAHNSRSSGMTRSQFDTAIRLIQLFQNRVTAVDAKLTVGKAKIQRPATVHMEGKLVALDEEGLTPAYFAGVTGVRVPLPGTEEYDRFCGKSRGDEIPFRRRTTSSVQNGKSVAGITGTRGKTILRRRQTVDNTLGSHADQNRESLRMQQMELEIVRLKNEVRSLSLEVRTLRARSASGESYLHENERPKVTGETSIIQDSRANSGREDDPNVDLEVFWGQSSTHKEKNLPLLTTSLPSSSSVPVKHTLYSSGFHNANTMNGNSSQKVKISPTVPSVHPSSRIPSDMRAMLPKVVNPPPLSHIPTETLVEAGDASAPSRNVGNGEHNMNNTPSSHSGDSIGTGSPGIHSTASNAIAAIAMAFPKHSSSANQQHHSRPRRRQTLSVAQSYRHIVRTKDGTTEVYKKEEIVQPSTKALDLLPLEPPPLPTVMDSNYDKMNPEKKMEKKKKFLRRLSMVHGEREKNLTSFY